MGSGWARQREMHMSSAHAPNTERLRLQAGARGRHSLLAGVARLVYMSAHRTVFAGAPLIRGFRMSGIARRNTLSSVATPDS